MCNLKGVKKIVIPSNTVEIDPLAFYNSQIAEFGVTINMNNPDEGNYSVLDGVLYSKDGKTLVRYPSAKADEEFIIPSTVTKIAENAFSGATNLKKVQIKSNVTEIGENAFGYCEALHSVVFSPNTVRVRLFTLLLKVMSTVRFLVRISFSKQTFSAL